jgi:hypothetical protein
LMAEGRDGMFARSSVFPGMLPAAPAHKLVIFASRT